MGPMLHIYVHECKTSGSHKEKLNKTITSRLIRYLLYMQNLQNLISNSLSVFAHLTVNIIQSSNAADEITRKYLIWKILIMMVCINSQENNEFRMVDDNRISLLY